MKILMTLMGLDIGGAETHVMELSKELTRRGHTVILASNGGAFVPLLEQRGVRHVSVPMNQRDPRLMLRSLRRLERLIKQEQPDLVHAHARIPAFLCGILQKRLHFPLITSAHGVFQVTPLLRLATAWGDRTVAISEDVKTYLMQNYQVPEDLIHVTVNGIDTETFAPGEETPGLRQQLGMGSGPTVVTVTRMDTPDVLHVAKELIAAAPELAEAVPGTELLIVGGGGREPELRALAEEANRLCGRPMVHVVGQRTDVALLLSLATVFVGVSRAALEAMSMAKPVILAGNPAYGQGYMGILKPELTAQAQESNFCCRGWPEVERQTLKQDVVTLLRMPAHRRRALGEHGRQVVQSQYSVARMGQDYLDAYETLLHPPKPVRAAISGYYGYGNLGDDAILCAISRQLSQMEHPVRLTVLSRRPKETARRFGLHAVNRFSPVGVLWALGKSDLLISGGGSLLQDRTSTRSLRYYLAVIRLARLLGRPTFLFANGIGPLDHRGSRRAVCRCVERCSAVTLRDADSLALLRDIGVTRQDVAVTADPAFTLRAEPGGRQQLTAQGVPPDAPLLGISVRRVAGVAGDPAAFARLCDRLARETGRTIVFLVMQEPGDSQLSREIQSRMTAPSWLVKPEERPEAMLAAIGCMDALVSMRLHTIIFAAEERVPVVGCVYDPKVDAFLKLLRMPSCGTPEALDEERAVAAVKALLQNRESARAALDQLVRPMEAQTAETAALLRQLLEWEKIIEA